MNILVTQPKVSVLSLFILLVFLLGSSLQAAPATESTENGNNKSPVKEIQLSPKEKAWLQGKHIVRVRAGNAPPFTFDDGGKIRGIAIDYINLIFRRNGIEFKYISGNEATWPEALEYIKKHEVVDMVPTAKVTQKRKEYMLFTNEYIFAPWVIFTREDADFISTIDDLKGKTVSVEEGYIMHKKLKREYPEINLLVSSASSKDYTIKPIRDVALGQADAYIGNLLMTTYMLQTQGYTNVKVAAPTPFGNHNQAMGIRNDWPELVSIINKTLDSMTPGEHAAIRNKWLSMRFEYGISPTSVLKWISGIIGVAALILIMILLWNRKLSREIQERKRAEEALRESEDKFRGFAEQSLVGIYLISDDVFKYVNPKFAEIFGYSVDECLDNVHFPQLVHPEDLATVEKQVGRRLSEETKSVQYSFRGIKKSGETIHVEIFGSSMVLKGKTVATGTMLDITERKQAEEALRESEERLRTIVEHSNELFYIHDTEHTLTYVSQTSEDLLGYTPEEMVIKWTELATDNPLNQKGVEITEKGIASGERQAPYLLELEKKDGTSVLLEIDESPVKDASEKVVAISGAARDVTEQRRTEQRLLKSEKGFRDLFDSITDLIYTQDLDGCFITVNHAMSALFGYEREAFIGMRASDLMRPEMMPFFESGYLEQIKTKRFHEGITSYFAKNGNEIYIEYRSSLVEPDHGEPYISGSGRDVTERVLSQKEIQRLQNQVLQSQKMEAIGLMAGGVAHDLNNILSGIVSYPELLLMDISEDSPLRKPIKTIQESGQRAADVVADLLTVARGVATAKEVFNLNSQIEGYLYSAEHRKLAEIHPSVTFKTEIDPDLLNIRCSPTHIKKTLMNLIGNAAEAIEGAGTVTISTTNQYLDEPLKGYGDVRIGEYTVLTISDDGSGITPEDLERIFEPFYTKKVMGRSGTGLGLAVVWNTVLDHDGYINVKSGNKGTVFELYFPVIRQAVAAEKEKVPLEDYLGHGEKILVVDDEERQREIACGMLTKLGYAAEAVSSGEEAIEYVKENPVDLIVLDMVMPKGIGGRETYEEIIKIHPGQKAIIASGFSETEDVKTVQKSGASQYIKKPYILEKIGVAIKEELAK